MKFNWKNFWIINICLCSLIVIGAEIVAYIYVNAKELVGHDFCAKKYWVSDEYHPSEEAWNEVVPKLAQRLNL